MGEYASFNRGLKKFKVKRIFRESIEPEEILLDATKAPDLEEQRLEVPIKQRIFKVFFGLVILTLAIIAGQAGYSQIVKGKYYQYLANRNSSRHLPIFAPRGIIYDRSMKQLVYNAPSFDLVVTPRDLAADFGQRKVVIDQIAKILAMSSGDFLKQIDQPGSETAKSYIVTENLAHEKVLAIEAELTNLTGFSVENSVTRQYVDGSYFSHILGYMGKLDQGDFRNNPEYFSTERIGKSGLELFYEKTLRGKPGEQINEVDSQGHFKQAVSSSEPQAGLGLVLAVDFGLQKTLVDAINRLAPKRSKAAALALDPKTGGVLAMVSLPTFDNNLFANGISREDYLALANDSSQPLFNRVIDGQYPPGSIIKPLIALAALQEKVIDSKTQIMDMGELVLVNQYNPGIIYHFPDWKAHGLVNMRTAIAQSCDVYFYTVGGGYGKIQGLGVDRIADYLKKFGLGGKTGIDLTGENEGLVPDESWKQRVKNEGWYTGDTYHLSIGQGDLLATPLQMAVATAAIANGGRLLAPYLVDKIIDSDKNIISQVEGKVLNNGFIDSQNIQIVREGMRQAVTSGSARLLNDLSVPTAAKTGTAQLAGQKNSNAWVTVFAPYDDPKIVLVILVEDAGEGSQVSVPIAKNVLEWYFGKK